MSRYLTALAAFAALLLGAAGAVVSPESEIVIAPDAQPAVRFAAKELSGLLSGVFGSSMRTANAPTPGKTHIFLGANAWAKEAGVLTNGLSRDSFRIKCNGNDVYVLGRDDLVADPELSMKCGVWSQHYERATLFGVYEFLERWAGVRMYFPGELGTVIPRLRSFEVPDGLDETVSPAFSVRRYSTYTDGEYFEGPKLFKVNPAKNLNALRLRMETQWIPCSHGQKYMRLLDRFGESHPEYFVLQNGKRRTDPSVSHPGIICLSSGVWEEIYRDCEAYLTGGDRGYKWGSAFKYGKYCDVMCQDGLIRCECGNCTRNTGKGRYWASEVVWSNTCAIANRLSEKGIPGFVTQMAYTSYRGIPKKVDIPDNVLVMLAQRGPWTLQEPRTFKNDFAELEGWVAKMHGRKTWLWTYLCKYRFLNLPDIPTVTPRAVGTYFKKVSPLVFGAYMESDGDRFLYNHLNYAVFSRICWHPETDVDAWLGEYYRLMYGAAASDIKAAFEMFEEKWTREIANKTVEMPDGPLANPPCEHFIWHEIYSPYVIDRLERLFDGAASKVSAESLEGRRVSLMRREMFEPLAARARRYVAVSQPSTPSAGVDAVVLESSGKTVSRTIPLDGSRLGFPEIAPFRRYRISFNVETSGIEPVDRGGGAAVVLKEGFDQMFPAFTAFNGTFPRSRKVYECFTGPDANRRGKRASLRLSLFKAKGKVVFDDIRMEEIPPRVEDVKPILSAEAHQVSDGWRLNVKVDPTVVLRHHFKGKAPNGFFIVKTPSGKIRKLPCDRYDPNEDSVILARTVRYGELASDCMSVAFELVTMKGRVLDRTEMPVGRGCAAEAKSALRIDFSDPAVAKGVRFASSGGGRATVTPVVDGVTLKFMNAKEAKFSASAISGCLKAVPQEKRPRDFYLKYRVRSFEGTAFARFIAPDAISHVAAFKRTGKVETMRLRPEIVSMRKGRQFDSRALSNVHICFEGSGDIDLLEFGATDVGPVKTPADDALPRVDSEAFALYPEPRIFRDTGKTEPLSRFGKTYSIAGDVPPGPVEWFKKEMRSFFGIDFAQSPKSRIEFAVVDGYDIEDYRKIKFDGFAIDVSQDRIRVAAKDQKGIVFGIHILCDMVKMATGDVGDPKVRLCTVVDWPRTDKRILNNMLHQWRTKYDPVFYSDICERFVVQSRFNLYALEPKMYRYDSVPFIPVGDAVWTRPDIEYVVDRLNSNAFVVIPKMNGLGHVRGWPLSTRQVAAKYGEDGDWNTLCTGNRDTMKILFDSFDEVLGICSRNRKYAPKYFHAGMDECRWKNTDATPVEKRCPRCAGIPRNRIFLDQVKRIDEWCRSRGVRMVMWSDMIRAYHNGLNKFKCHEIESEIPKDVIYDNWSSWDFFEIPESVAAGRENWRTLTGFKDDPEGDQYATAHGLYICTATWWLVDHSRHGRRDGAPYGLMAQRILGDFMWRNPPEVCAGDGGSATDRVGDGMAKVRRWGDFIMRNWSRKPIPRGAATFSTVNMDATAKLPLSAAFDAEAKSLSGVPVSLVAHDGKVMAAEADMRGTAFNIGRKAASFAFLHVATVPEKSIDDYYSPTNYFGMMTGPLIAEYDVQYEDGTKSKAEIRLGWNTAEYSSRSTLFGVFARYPADCRAMMTGALPAAKPADPVAPDAGVATMYEWVNPHPEKTIKSLTLARKDGVARYAVLAITARDVANVRK